MAGRSNGRTQGQGGGSWIERMRARAVENARQREFNAGRRIRYDAGRPRFKPTFTDAGLNRANLRGAIDTLLSDQRQLDDSPPIKPASKPARMNRRQRQARGLR